MNTTSPRAILRECSLKIAFITLNDELSLTKKTVFYRQ